uniref:Variant surface glycoprotein n=1 Tax=Trypanosoma brucei gambiense TaxID=31285 RepID=Q26836_TRYBG|nr:variant surface glycoprotein [Trypanosoma brucei gambiense]
MFLPLTLAFILAHGRLGTAVQEKALGPQTTEAICDVAAYFRIKLDGVTSAQAAAPSKTQAATVNLLRIKVLFERTKSAADRRRLLAILAATEAEHFKATGHDLPAAAAQRLAAAKDAAYFLGSVHEYLSIAGHKKVDSTAGCFATNTAGAGPTTATYAELQTWKTNCKAADLTKTGDFSTTGKFSAGGLEPIGGRPTDLTASESKCRLHSGADNEGVVQNAGADNNGLLLAGGLLKLGATTPTFADLSQLNSKKDKPDIQTMYRAYTSTTETADDLATGLPSTPEQLAKKPLFAAALSKITASKKPLTGNELTTAITNLYGKPTEDLQTQLWSKMINIKAPADHSSEDKGKPLTDINDIDLLLEMLVNATVDAASSQAASDRSQCSAPTTEQSINVDEIKEKECNTKKAAECAGDCVLDGETCKAKKKGEAENKEKDGKAALTCAGKDEKTCGTTQGCKWENSACKDSSTLVPKKFALSMVFAAFVALLF